MLRPPRLSHHLGLIRRSERSTRIATAAVGMALAIAAGWLALFRLGGSITSLSYDLPFIFHRGGIPADVRLVLLDELEGAAIDRRGQAKLLTQLKQAGARAVIYDLIFDRPSPDPAVDQDFAAAMRDFRGVPADAPPGTPGERLIFLACERSLINQAGVIGEQLNPPTDVLLDAADDFGLVALVHDDRFCVRELSTGTRDEASVTWKAAAALGAKLEEKDRLAQRWIDYAGPTRTIPACSGEDVLRGVEPGFLRDKVVIVGGKPELLGAAAGKDLFSTPFHRLYHRSTLPLMGGVEVQANIFAGLLHGNFITRPSRAFEIALVLAFGAASGALLAWLRPLRGVMVAASVAIGLIVTGVLAMHFGGVWFAWTVPAFVQLPVALAWGAAANFYIERYFRLRLTEDQRRLRDAFAKYLSPQMLDRLTAEGFAVQLGGQRTTAAMMFTDLEGFTDMCQRVSNPERIVETLNDYFRRTTGHVFANGGVIIKFIGDAIFAAWGVPLDDPEAPANAIRAAWRLHESDRLVVDGEDLRTRVGVHFGEIVAGNVGSEEHIDYTLIGDAVNLTARLEGLNKMFGTSILLTESVRGRLGAEWRLRFLGRFCVKGRREVTIVHELLGPARQEGEPAWITRYAEAQAALERGDRTEARQLFSAANSERKNGDRAAREFLERLDAGEPFPGGIFELKEK